MKNKNRNKWNKKDMKFIFTCHFIPLYHQSQHQPYRQQHVATSEWRATTIRRSAREVAERESDWGRNTLVHRLWWTDERPYLCHQWEKHWFDIHRGYLDLRGEHSGVPQFTTIHISADLSGAQVFIDEDNDFNAELAAAWIERIWQDRHSRYGWSLGRPYYPNHLTVNAFAGDITLSLEAGICSSALRQTRSFRLSHVICIDKQKARLVCLLFAYFPAAFVAETERWNSC